MTTEDKDNKPKSVAITRDKSAAQAFAALWSPDLIADIETSWTAKETLQMSPLEYMADIEAMYSEDTEALELLPVPGSKEVKGSNTPYDKYSYSVPNDKGGKRNVNGSFYGDAFDASAPGKIVAEHIEDLAAADRNTTTKTNAAYIAMTKFERQTERAMWAQRRTTAIDNMRDGIGCIKQFAAFDTLTLVGASIVTKVDGDGDKVMAVSRLPIRIYKIEMVKGKDKKETPLHTTMAVVSIGQFLTYDVEAAKENGGTYEAIVATATKGPKDGKDGKPLNLEGYEASAGLMAGYLEKNENLSLIYRKLNTKPLDEAFLRSQCDLFVLLKPIYDKYHVQYDNLNIADNAKVEALRQAQASK